MRVITLIVLGVLCSISSIIAQPEDDLLSLLGEEEETTDFVTASFKSTRVINAHSLENVAKGVLDIKISHRFGFLNGGFYELFGLDNASIRIGGDYGITNWLMVGAGRSSFEKIYDGFVKVKFLRQSTGKVKMPITLAGFASGAITTLKWQDPDRENYFSSRMFYTFQLIMGRKYSDGFSLQVMPTLVHRNLVKMSTEANDVFSIGVAARQKITKRLALTAEYFYVLPDQLAPGFRDSFSVGIDLETGGHVFQLHFTNSTSMVEKGYIAETVGDWTDGGVHFGFNVSRVFTLGGGKGH